MKSIESTHQSSNIHCQLHDLQGWNGEKVTELEYLTVKEFITRSQCQLSDGNRINAEICLLSDTNQRAWSLLELWLLPYLAFLKGGPFFLSAPFPFPFFEASSSSLRFFAAAVGSDLTTFAAVKNESMRNWKRFCYSSVLNIKIMFKKYKFREKKKRLWENYPLIKWTYFDFEHFPILKFILLFWSNFSKKNDRLVIVIHRTLETE